MCAAGVGARDLPSDATAALRSAAEASVSVVSPWEVTINAAAGKLRLGEPPAQWFSGMVERYELREVPLHAHVACAAAALPAIHRDPIDRILVALAQAHTLTILTSDHDIPKYPGVKTLW